MNRERAKELLPVMRAFAEGKTVEVRHKGARDGRWADLGNNTLWLDSCDYRVKHEPRRMWINYNTITGTGMARYDNQAQAEADAKRFGRDTVEFVEVLRG